MAVEPSGRLELTWTNKHLRLLADEDGGYTWVPPSDYRVAEVRLLHEIESVGETHGERRRAEDNLLLQGDALHALTSLCRLPEYAAEYVGKVKLAYLDPPFNTQQAFEHYDDALEHSVWLRPAHRASSEPRHRQSLRTALDLGNDLLPPQVVLRRHGELLPELLERVEVGDVVEREGHPHGGHRQPRQRDRPAATGSSGCASPASSVSTCCSRAPSSSRTGAPSP